MFKLYVDGTERIVRSTEAKLRKAMWKHLASERAKGRSISAIEFCWHHVQVGSV